MIGITGSGDFKNSRDFLDNLIRGDLYSELDRYGRMGVDALARATPANTGLTGYSWGYRVIKDLKNPGIEWFNTNAVNGTSIAILIQYGHGTGTGGYVPGRDFINAAMQPIFDQITAEVWKKVNR